jgi:ABC-type nitrate/sulfonate/bicarbonate transport system substrate-binding protein
VARVSLAVLAAALLAAAGCGGNGNSEVRSLDIGYAYGADVGDVGDVLALRELERETGLSTDVRDLGGNEEAVVGLTRGDVELAQVGYRQFLDAVSAGAPIKAVLGQNMASETVLVGGPNVRSVRDLEGKQVSTGTVGGAGDSLITKALVAAGMSRDDSKVVYIDDSTSRAAALLTGRIAAAALDYADVELLRRREPGEYTVLDRAVDRSPNAPQLIWAVDSDWAQEHDDILREVVPALVRGYEDVYSGEGREAWLREAKESFLQGKDAAAAAPIYDFYREIGMWPKASTAVTKAQHDLAVEAWLADDEIEAAVAYEDSWLPDYWTEASEG